METKVATGIVALITLVVLRAELFLVDLMHTLTHRWFETGRTLHFVAPFALLAFAIALGIFLVWLWSELFVFFDETKRRKIKLAQRRMII